MSKKFPGHLMKCFAENHETQPTPLNLHTASKDERTPREVFQEVCTNIASRLELENFQYLKSKKLIKKKQDDLTYIIKFSTSRWNIRSINVQLSASIEIYSETFSDWIKQNRRFDDNGPFNALNWSGITGGGLHNIVTESIYQNYPGIFYWNVAHLERREEIIDDFEAFLRKFVLPYFELFSDPSKVIKTLITGDKDCRSDTSIPNLELSKAIEYALCFGTPQEAAMVLYRHNKLLSNLHGTEVERRFQTFKQSGLSRVEINEQEYLEEIDQIKKFWTV